MKTKSLLLLVAIAPAVSVGCSSPNHDALAAKDASVSEPASDAGGDSGAHDASDGAVITKDTGPSDATSTIQPDGVSRVLLVHGIVDLRNVMVCFEGKKAEGQIAALSGPAIPQGKIEGLAYGTTVEVHVPQIKDVDSGAPTMVRPVLLSGDLGAVQKASCGMLGAFPPTVHEWRLPWVPSSAFEAGRLVVLVAAGCAHEAGSDQDHWKEACGDSHGGNLTLLASSPSRTTKADSIGMQLLPASLASPLLTLTYHASEPNYVINLASHAGVGSLAPVTPGFQLSEQGLGLDPDKGQFEFFGDPPGDKPAMSVPLIKALDHGELSLDAMRNGTSFVLVAVGPVPGLELDSKWHTFSAVLVRTNEP